MKVYCINSDRFLRLLILITTTLSWAESQRCGCDTCDSTALSTMAGAFECGARIDWLQMVNGLSEYNSCVIVANQEFPEECAPCDPLRCNTAPPISAPPTRCGCSSCSDEILNRPATDSGGTFSCDARISWLLQEGIYDTEEQACEQVAHVEFPNICGPGCDPLLCNNFPTRNPTPFPTRLPTLLPTHSPTRIPTELPTRLPPTLFPTHLPTISPTRIPTLTPTGSPTRTPTGSPTRTPTGSPTRTPTGSPTRTPTGSPTRNPTGSPTRRPTKLPTESPSRTPTKPPTIAPTISNFKCGCASCTTEVLNRPATDSGGTFSCNDRIDWLLANGNYALEEDACTQVAHVEFPTICGPACDPTLCDNDNTPTPIPTEASPTFPPIPPTTDGPEETFCGCDLCTQEILDSYAGEYTCDQRMQWLRNELDYSVEAACTRVADEFPSPCGVCNYNQCNPEIIDDPDPEDLVWSDEFDGPNGSAPDPLNWDYDTGGGGWGNGELQHYTNRRENSFVSNGILNIRAVKETFGSNSYTSARLVTKNLKDWTYGRFRVRARLQQCTGVGTWPAIWMLPTEWKYGGWPDSGEIDIMEHVGYDTGKVHGTVHTGAFNHIIGTQKGGSITTDVSEWHIYDVIWTQSKVEFIMDGIKYYEFSKVDNASFREWPFNEKFHLILNIAVGGSWGGANGVDSEAFEGNGQIMEVDWVRVYQDNAPAPPPIPVPNPTSSPPAGTEIKVMSYNTEYTGYFDGRITGFGAKISEVGADIVGVQECQDPDALASASGYAFVSGTGSQNYIFYNSARVVVLESGWFSIPRDDYAPRTVTWAKFKTVDGTDNDAFIFFNTHLPHRHGEASDANTHASIGQTLLAKRVGEIGASDMPTVVVCDCNPFASDGAPAGSFEDVLSEAGIPRYYVANGNPGYGGLDKIFASSSDWSGSRASDVGTGGSDHTAISVYLAAK